MHQDTLLWRARLEEYLDTLDAHGAPLPDGHMLHALHHWQRRVTGGGLLELLEWLTSEDALARYPILAERPLTERVFVFISDVPGLVAYREIVDRESTQTLGLLKPTWRAFLSDDDQDHDDTWRHHYEAWSVWHREIDPQWDLAEEAPFGQLWVHEEGFAIGEEAGRGSQHVWSWSGDRLQLIKQDITKWVY